MSGLQHDLGSVTDHDGEAIEFPAIGGDDRALALYSVWVAGYVRGVYDGKMIAGMKDDPTAAPAPAPHLKAHADHCLRSVAKVIGGASLERRSLVGEWIEGHKAGFEAAYFKFS